MRLVPIDSTKNIVQFNTAVPTATVVSVTLALGVNPTTIDETDASKTFMVEDGAMIRGFAISLRLFNESGVADSASSLMLIRKNEGNTLGLPTLAQMNSLGTADWKNKIFHTEQAITGSQVSGWPMGFPSIKIPKRYHKMSHNDSWQLLVANNTGNQLRMCGSVIYKWYK